MTVRCAAWPSWRRADIDDALRDVRPENVHEAGIHTLARLRLAHLIDHLVPATLLDVGCGDGRALGWAMRGRRIDALGIDPAVTDSTVPYPRCKMTATTFAAQRRRFNLVCAIHSIGYRLPAAEQAAVIAATTRSFAAVDLLLRPRPWMPPDVAAVSVEELTEALAQRDLRVESQRPFCGPRLADLVYRGWPDSDLYDRVDSDAVIAAIEGDPADALANGGMYTTIIADWGTA